MTAGALFRGEPSVTQAATERPPHAPPPSLFHLRCHRCVFRVAASGAAQPELALQRALIVLRVDKPVPVR